MRCVQGCFYGWLRKSLVPVAKGVPPDSREVLAQAVRLGVSRGAADTLHSFALLSLPLAAERQCVRPSLHRPATVTGHLTTAGIREDWFR